MNGEILRRTLLECSICILMIATLVSKTVTGDNSTKGVQWSPGQSSSLPPTLTTKNSATSTNGTKKIQSKVIWNEPKSSTKPVLLSSSKSVLGKVRNSQLKTEELHTPADTLITTVRRQRSVGPTTNRKSLSQTNSHNTSQVGFIHEDEYPGFYYLKVNGSCDHFERSSDATNEFAAAFQEELDSKLETLKLANTTQNGVESRAWEIYCGNGLVLNFSLNTQPIDANAVGSIILSPNKRPFGFTWNNEVFSAKGFSQRYSDLVPHSHEHELSRLQVGPATGHFYQGFIYIIIGTVVGVAVLVLATVCLVRLHRRQKSRVMMSSSGDATPTKTFSDASDYTLTRMPRTTKLYETDYSGWGYTNPDFRTSSDHLSKSSPDVGHLHFINTGLLPKLNPSSKNSDYSQSMIMQDSSKNSDTGTSSSGYAHSRSSKSTAVVDSARRVRKPPGFFPNPEQRTEMSLPGHMETSSHI